MSQEQSVDDTQSTEESLQVVSFILDRGDGKKEDYAVPIEAVKEIRSLEEITHVPNAKSYVRGVMNLRGLIIPVIDIKSKLGFPQSEINKDDQRILVLEVEDNLYGLLVDGVDQVMKLPINKIDPPPTGSFEGDQFIKGIAKTDDRLIIFLNVPPLISDSDIENTKDTIQEKESTGENKEPEKAPEIEPTPQSESSIDVDAELPDEIKELFDKEVIAAEPA